MNFTSGIFSSKTHRDYIIKAFNFFKCYLCKLKMQENSPITFSTRKKMFYLSYVELNGFFIGHAFLRERK